MRFMRINESNINVISNRLVDVNEKASLKMELNEDVLKKLPISWREILEMRYYEGMKQKQIALFFNCAQSNISYTITRALKAYRSLEALNKPKNYLSDLYDILYKEIVDYKKPRTSYETRMKRLENYLSVLTEFDKHYSQTRCAKELSLNQSTVRSILTITQKMLSTNDSVAAKYLSDTIKLSAKIGNYYQKKKDPELNKP